MMKIGFVADTLHYISMYCVWNGENAIGSQQRGFRCTWVEGDLIHGIKIALRGVSSESYRQGTLYTFITPVR